MTTRVLLVLLLAAPAAHAQPALFRGAPAAAPHWRAGVDAGLSATLGGVASVEVERTVAGPFSVGARALIYDSQRGIPMDDGGGIDGSAAEGFASVGLRRRVADLRVFGGVGASSVRSFSGGLPLEPGDFSSGTTSRSGVRSLRPHLVGGVGIDLYPLPGVGVGGTIRVAASATAVPLATVSLGLRVRLAR